METNIYNLDLHETTILNCGVCVMRVPGGWIYDCWDFINDSYKMGTFVPYSREFI